MEQQDEQPQLRVDAVVRLKHDLEKSRWHKRIAIKIVEAGAFAGMFLCSNPLGFTCCVLIAAIAVLCDVWLGYNEWKQEWTFKQMTL